MTEGNDPVARHNERADHQTGVFGPPLGLTSGKTDADEILGSRHMHVAVESVEEVTYWDCVVHVGGEVPVFVELCEFSVFELKEGASPLVAGRNEDLVILYDGGSRVGAVTGLPFFEGEGLAVGGI